VRTTGTSPGPGEKLRDASKLTRRRLVGLGAAATAGVVVGGLELVAQGVLPGHELLDEIDGACSVSAARQSFFEPGPSLSGSFHSAARRREVGYTISYPPGHRPGDELPLLVALHGYGGNHADVLGISSAQALALKRGERHLAPMAIVAADGGPGYWNRHPDDDPMGMLVDELIPMCRARGLGRPPMRIGAIGVSMGGYGALLLAEKEPRLISAVAAISPAIWTSYAQARSANAGAYASQADFEEDDVVTHVAAIARTPVRVASGIDDPFHPGVLALARALPPSAVVEISKGCHDSSFFSSQRPASFDFLAAHVA
jgi:pimeloyl-ACP methyl ester carboxylesterase